MGLLTKWLKSVKERWLTWRTGKSTEQREWEAWYETNVNYRASKIDNMFRNFKHVIMVDVDKFVDYHEPFAWIPNEDASQYFWPNRELGNNAVWRFERVIKCPATANQWEINELGGEDKIFVATNNDTDALLIALKYS